MNDRATNKAMPLDPTGSGGVSALSRPTDTAQAIAMVERARDLLAAAQTFEEKRRVKDLAAAAKVFLRGQKAAHEAAISAGEIELRATRMLGEALRNQDKAKGGRPPKKTGSKLPPVSGRPTLFDLEVSKDQSRRWQALAKIPAPKLEQYIDRSRAGGRVPNPHGAQAFGEKAARRERILEHIRSEPAELVERRYSPKTHDLSNDLGLVAQEIDALKKGIARALRAYEQQTTAFDQTNRDSAVRVQKKFPELKKAMGELDDLIQKISGNEPDSEAPAPAPPRPERLASSVQISELLRLQGQRDSDGDFAALRSVQRAITASVPSRAQRMLNFILDGGELALLTLGLDWSVTHESLSAAFREASRKHHPDRGGVQEDFIAVNRSRGLIAEMLKEDTKLPEAGR